MDEQSSGRDRPELTPGRRATVHDVARAAGVSLATVDRVLNRRPGVRAATAEKVAAAIAALDFRRDLSASLLARSRDLNLHFFIPDGANAFMDNLAAAIRRQARGAGDEQQAEGEGSGRKPKESGRCAALQPSLLLRTHRPVQLHQPPGPREQ